VQLVPFGPGFVFPAIEATGSARGEKGTRRRDQTDPSGAVYLVSERKLGFFVKIKEDKNFNRRNTLSILRIKIFI